MNTASWKNNILRAALLAVTTCALPALAGPDNVGLGTGRDGPLTVASNTSVVINSYAQVTAPLAPGDTGIVVASTTGFAMGDLVLVMQMTGIVPEPPTGGPSPVDITNDAVGRWEFARLASVAGTTLNLTAPLVNSYASNVTQVIRVREQTSVTINPLGNITAPAWDGSTGGVVALLATGTVTLSASPSINVTARGFRGGTAVEDTSLRTGCTELDEPAPAGAQKGEGIAFTRFGASQTGRGRVANGGGGGVCLKSGGGGGGNGGTGGQGGNSDLDADSNRPVGGQGGAALAYPLLSRLVMGGGGGAGHVQTPSATTVRGGVGGGIIFVRANALSGSGTMVANGGTGGSTTGENAASGGGGGGSIYVRIATSAICGNLQAIGGTGGNANEGSAVGPGGGGGGGRVLLQKASGSCAPTSTAVNGASAGVQQESTAPGGSAYNAQPGAAGSSTLIPATGFAVLPAPVVNAPANNSRTSDSTPTYSGTIPIVPALPAGTEVAIFVDGVEVGRVTPDALGNWTLTPTAPLAGGSHTVTAVAINTAQAVQSQPSNTNTFVVDLVPPTVSVTTPAEGSHTTDTTPEFTGTVSDNGPGPLTVVIRVDGTVLGNATVMGNMWTFTPLVPLAEGSHTVTATATDDVGNSATDSNNFTVDATPPSVAVTEPAEGSRTNDNTPTYSGTVSDNGPGPITVVITVDGTVLGNATVTGNTWTFTPTEPLGDGPHTVTATATDPANNSASDSNNFTVDTTAPAVEVVAPAEGSRTNDTTPTYSGTVEAGATVVISVDGTVLGNATVTDTTWTFTSTVPLAQGSHTVTATATDVAGNTATDSNTFTVDTTAPTVEVVAPAEGARTNDNTPVFFGTVEAGATVTIRVDGVVLGNATVTGNTWTFTPTVPLADGEHTVTATATDAAGNTATDSNTFNVDTLAPAAPVVITPANGSTISDNTPTYSGTAEPGSIVTVIVDGVSVGTTTADPDGNWDFTQTPGLSNGQHTVTAEAMDAAGNISPRSNTNTFTVDATIPVAPVITGPANNTVTNDNTPPISGTAPPNSTVTVIIDGTPVGTTTSDAAGNWTFTPTVPLADGPHDITATTTNAVGNTSPPSNTVRIVVDTGVPDTTIVSGPAGNTESTSATFTFSSNEAGVTYECSLDGASYVPCSNPATFADLAEGEHTLLVRARDAAGNVDPSPAMATWTVVRATPPPVGDRDFLGDGIGCAASGGDPSSLAMMGLGLLAVLLVRRRRQQ
jgi:MYXO-CTERM domain-containing protein